MHDRPFNGAADRSRRNPGEAVNERIEPRSPSVANAHAERAYRVALGHLQVTVRANSRQHAVELAARELCQELPRLWDVIRATPDDQFQVAPLNDPGPFPKSPAAEK